MKDPTSQLRLATRRAKSDVANKLVSMFLHELSRKISAEWPMRVDSEEYEAIARKAFNNRCPYCGSDLTSVASVVEHLDGLNRYRAGLHAPGNVLVACKNCNSEKRRDDSLKVLSLARTGWESFLSHDGTRCAGDCLTCSYWKRVWEDDRERQQQLATNLDRIRQFRRGFPEFEKILPLVSETLPSLLTKLYADCQAFAENEIHSLLATFEQIAATRE